MCKLYSITTNQAAIINLFRVVNRYVGSKGVLRRNPTATRSHDGRQMPE